MNIPPLFNILASAALLSTPLHAQLYTLHGDGVKKTERVVEKADYSDYELVWHDEFDKDGRPDPAKWNYEHGFVRNKEAQWYQPENAYCKDGMLIIEGRKEKHANPHYDPEGKNWQTTRKEAEYTSASLTTRSKFSWLYGRFEIRARFSPREGMWPAFWTLGVKEKWPMCGEIDIMEYYQSTKSRLFSGRVPVTPSVLSKLRRSVPEKVSGPPRYRILPLMGRPCARPAMVWLTTA